jgi:hypothetical protein
MGQIYAGRRLASVSQSTNHARTGEAMQNFDVRHKSSVRKRKFAGKRLSRASRIWRKILGLRLVLQNPELKPRIRLDEYVMFIRSVMQL